MTTTKMILAVFSALFFAATGDITAKADIAAATTVIQPHPGTEAMEALAQTADPAAGGQAAEQQLGPEAAGDSEAAATETAPQPTTGEQVAAYASQFIGNPYVYGGTSLTNGADCSGFVLKVYEQFGVPLPRTSRDQGRVGADVGGIEHAQPGDIVSYRGHIGIYKGQNQLVHASDPKGGIKISPVNYKPILSVRRVL